MLTLTTHGEIDAIKDLDGKVLKVAVYVEGKPFFPCGICRQFLFEYDSDCIVYWYRF